MTEYLVISSGFETLSKYKAPIDMVRRNYICD